MAETGEKGRIRKERLLILLAILVGGAVLVFGYLSWTSYTNLSTGILTAIFTALCFTFGYAISNHWRCASMLFLTQLLSPFGLLVTFDSLSWLLLIMPNMEMILNFQDRMMSDAICTYTRSNELSHLEILIGNLHYCPLIAFGLVFTYSFCYVVLFEGPQSNNLNATPVVNYPGAIPVGIAGQQNEATKRSKLVRLLDGIGDVLKHLQFGIFMLAVTLSQWRVYSVSSVNKLIKHCAAKEEYKAMSGVLLTCYLVGSFICVLILLFASKSEARRDHTIQKFKAKSREENQPSVYFLRAKASNRQVPNTEATAHYSGGAGGF